MLVPYKEAYTQKITASFVQKTNLRGLSKWEVMLLWGVRSEWGWVPAAAQRLRTDPGDFSA